MTEKLKPDGICHGRIWNGFNRHRCGNKAKVDGLWCKIHDPVAIEKKNQERKAKWDREWEAKQKQWAFESDLKKFRSICVDAIRNIAAGHNDARGLAQEILAKEPKAPNGS